MKAWLEKLSVVGAVIAVAACVCFPRLALIGAFFGVAALGAYGYHLFIAAQVLVGIAVAVHALAYRRHRNVRLLGAAAASGAAVFSGHLFGWAPLAYAGFAGLIVASATDFWNWLRHETAATQADR